MAIKDLIFMAVGAIAFAGASSASQSLSPVVSIQYIVSEGDPEQLVAMVIRPVERAIQKLDRVVQINASTRSGNVDVEIRFKDEVTKQDLASDIDQLETVNFGNKVEIVSRTIGVKPPRLSYDSVEAHP